MHYDQTDLTDLFKDKESGELRVQLYNADPNCEHKIVSGNGGSGIKCAKCPGWFCY